MKIDIPQIIMNPKYCLGEFKKKNKQEQHQILRLVRVQEAIFFNCLYHVYILEIVWKKSEITNIDKITVTFDHKHDHGLNLSQTSSGWNTSLRAVAM